MRTARAVRASLLATAMAASAIAIAAPAHASSPCSSGGSYQVCASATYYPHIDGHTSITVWIQYGGASTDFRVTVPSNPSFLIWPGQQITKSRPGGGSVTVCATEASLGNHCVTVQPYTSPAS
ncbi:hypothetical protein [Kitasatospora sp. McL0602]|uniref:hypothetical protein n=1 Tax=Kitasatospora sp. McL0602 TaxID=3439530 RepID=UPI003F8A1C9E